jgi:PLP dependent protein
MPFRCAARGWFGLARRIILQVMTEAEIRVRLSERLRAVNERIESACRRAGRSRSDVTLVAVTKTVEIDVVRLLPDLGVLDVGESRPQALWRKSKALAGAGLRWHFIGHLQRNKAAATIPFIARIHSIDSLRLLDEINRVGQTLQSAIPWAQGALPAMLEVNASREASKHGFAPEQVREALGKLANYPQVQVDGLMTMAAYADDSEQCRSTFRELRLLRDAAGLRHLSMGMSNDFEVAIEEGATHVRLGTVLFEGMEAPDAPGET